MKPLNPAVPAWIAIGKAPFIGCKPPSSESSPMIKYLSTSALSICPEAAKIPMAIGRS